MKRSLIVGIVLTILSATQAQTRLTLLVKADTPSAISKVDLMNFEQTHSLQAAYADSIFFEFPSTGTDVYNIRFHKNGKLAWQQIWLDTGNITISGRVERNNFLIDTVVGSPVYDAIKKYYRELGELNKQQDTAAINNYLVKAYGEHANNSFSGLIGASFMRKNGHNQLEVARLYGLIAIQPEKVKKHPFVQSVITSISNITAKAPLNFEGYSFYSVANKEVPMLFNEASFYVLDLWYTACKPCILQHRDIAARQDQLKAAGVRLIGISTDRVHATWKYYLEKHKYNWDNVRVNATKDWVKETGYSSFPSYIILDKNKKVLAYYGHFTNVLEYFKLN